MIGTRRVLIPGSSDAYVRKVLATNPIAYWPLSERTGSVAYDVSGNGLHGALGAAQLGYAGMGDGRTAIYLPGDVDNVDVYTAGLAAAFSPSAGSSMIWATGTDAVWTDGVARRLQYAYVDSSNYVMIRRSGNYGLYGYYTAGGTAKYKSITGIPSGLWVSVIVTWSVASDQLIVYINGQQDGAAVTGLGTWSGTISTARIGGLSTSTGYTWIGQMAHGAFWNRTLSPTEAAALGVVR